MTITARKPLRLRQVNLAVALLSMVACAIVAGCGAAGKAGHERTTDGVIVRPADDPARVVRLSVVADRIVRVTAFPGTDPALPSSLMAVRTGGSREFELALRDGKVELRTPALLVQVSTRSGAVTFRNPDGSLILGETEGGRTFQPVKVQEQSFHAIRQQFDSPPDEAFHGLGQHQDGWVNFKGRDVELAQHNMDVGIPFVVSSRNYGILWDNNSITRFGDPREWQQLSDTLDLSDANGAKGGLTATYSVEGRQRLVRQEGRIDYQYIRSLRENYPPELRDVPAQRVVWEGSIAARSTGRHTFTLYASDYHRLYVDGELRIDAWRQNWNPWYRPFELDMIAGQPRAIRIEWDRSGGYLALLHRDPLPANEQGRLSLFSEVAHAIDYYFIAGASADEVIAGYRHVTGKATLLPVWAYGFWQSRERYKTQDELLGVVREHRRRGIPLDNIVQDWFYWKEDSWGSHQFDPQRFVDPQAMIDEIHRLNARLMISVWPKFYPATDTFQELDARGYIYRRNLEQGEKDWVGPGYLSSFYDPYAPEARALFWRRVDERLNRLGVDAWWLDATEPDMHSNLDIGERKLRMGPTALGPGAQFFNSYPLMNAMSVYEGDRAADPGQRVFILTRSAFAGLQRYAAATWSGDVASRWSDLREQISAGISFSLSGLPNWTTDIGGFAVERRYENPDARDLAEWRELNARWFQFGTFTPLFRSHGQFPLREIYNLAPAGSEIHDSMVAHARLRYRLLPYIYTLAGMTWHDDYTLMRGLFMDFPQDAMARDVGDEFMLGPALLVAPVHEYQARSREVYLPAGVDWHDFHSGALHAGGRRITVAAPVSRIPLFVRAGSILPVGPERQHVGDKPGAPVALHVYTGADGSFMLYEDSGLDYGYERGEFVRIALSWDESDGTLTIGPRIGSFPGMSVTRTFEVHWITPGSGGGAGRLDAAAPSSVQYSGTPVTLRMPRPTG